MDILNEASNFLEFFLSNSQSRVPREPKLRELKGVYLTSPWNLEHLHKSFIKPRNQLVHSLPRTFRCKTISHSLTELAGWTCKNQLALCGSRAKEPLLLLTMFQLSLSIRFFFSSTLCVVFPCYVLLTAACGTRSKVPREMFIKALTITAVKFCCHVMIIIIFMSVIINLNIINKIKINNILHIFNIITIFNIINIIKYY